MFVYVAEIGYMYEGAHTTAVFSTEPRAREWVKEQQERGGYNPDHKWSSVIPYKVDAPEWEEA